MSDFTTWVEKNKGLWTRVYDEVIAPDFEKEWQKSMGTRSRCTYISANDASGEEEHEAKLKQSVYTTCLHELDRADLDQGTRTSSFFLITSMNRLSRMRALWKRTRG